MRGALVLLFLCPMLSGCVVAHVAGAAVDGAVTVTSTAVHVTGAVVKGTADVVTGGDKKKKSDDDD
ncbi:MAG TPA: hypothetical protein VG819_06575 [Rhizomicrobium sp.]|nr:hypothetical protein [Rhizomicrobium sp.]